MIVISSCTDWGCLSSWLPNPARLKQFMDIRKFPTNSAVTFPYRGVVELRVEKGDLTSHGDYLHHTLPADLTNQYIGIPVYRYTSLLVYRYTAVISRRIKHYKHLQ